MIRKSDLRPISYQHEAYVALTFFQHVVDLFLKQEKPKPALA